MKKNIFPIHYDLLDKERIEVFKKLKPFKKEGILAGGTALFKDIALDKAFTIGRRALWRDYVDLFFLLKKNYINFSNVIKFAEKKFGIEFNTRLFLEQLIYFKDLEIIKISWIKEKYSPKEIQEFLIKAAKDYFRIIENKGE